MLVPQMISKTKLGFVNGKVVPVEYLEVEQICNYDINDFTEEGLQAIIDAGHEDYFTEEEKVKLAQDGLIPLINPQLSVESSGIQGIYKINYLGAGTISGSMILVVRNSETKTRGAGQGSWIKGGSDTLNNQPVVSITMVTDNVHGVYTQGVDYQLSGDSVDWSLSGDEPELGRSYDVVYTYNGEIDLSEIYDESSREIDLRIQSLKQKLNKNIVGGSSCNLTVTLSAFSGYSSSTISELVIRIQE